MMISPCHKIDNGNSCYFPDDGAIANNDNGTFCESCYCIGS